MWVFKEKTKREHVLATVDAYFFFQAEDGIRDLTVTGVQTCALPIFAGDFPGLRGRVSRLENGPPVGFPVQFRVSGENIETVRKIARETADIMRQEPDRKSVV